MKLSIIIPVFNEEKTIQQVLQKLVSVALSKTTKEIIVVDDGSFDGTPVKVKAFRKKHPDIVFIQHPKNKGKGAAVRTGIAKATGEYMLIQDADLEYEPIDIQKLLMPILQGEAEVVYGSRLKRAPNFSRDERTPTFFIHYVGNKLLSLVTSTLYGQWITDMETGYKLFPAQFAKSISLHARSFELEPELTAKILKKGYYILEVSISTNPRKHSEGKKLVAVKDGPIALWTLIKYRFID